jgi:polyferredoxin
VIHIASVLEWLLAIALVWRYGEATGEAAWRRFAWAMLPALIGAMAVLVWHYFDNVPALEYLGTVQAAMTVLGNTTLALAAFALARRPASGDREH